MFWVWSLCLQEKRGKGACVGHTEERGGFKVKNRVWEAVVCRYNVRFMRIFVEVEIVPTKVCCWKIFTLFVHIGHNSQQMQAPRPRRAVALVTWVERLKLIFLFFMYWTILVYIASGYLGLVGGVRVKCDVHSLLVHSLLSWEVWRNIISLCSSRSLIWVLIFTQLPVVILEHNECYF